jgi:U3 small nucleolar RNA-associated protein 3
MGKRKTAKTGDKALYGSREQLANQGIKKKTDDDNMYNEVDRFHNEKDDDFIRLGEDERQKNNNDDEDEDLAGNTHSVLDLGAGGISSSEEEDDDDDSSSDEEDRFVDKKGENYSSSEDDSDSSDDDDGMIKDDPRNWGKKKSLYYQGDTADLEIGQEEDDAFLEEEAAQEIQQSRFDEMDEDDFVLSGDDEEGGSASKKADDATSRKSKQQHEELQTIRDASKLSKKETRKLLDKQYPGTYERTMLTQRKIGFGWIFIVRHASFLSHFSLLNCCCLCRTTPDDVLLLGHCKRSKGQNRDCNKCIDGQ